MATPAAFPLFTSETVAPTTPPVLLRLFQEPTEANARAFLDWQQARLKRIQEVQVLLERLCYESGATKPVTFEEGALTPDSNIAQDKRP